MDEHATRQHAEAMAVWGDVTQRALREMVDLASRTSRETARQLTEWQRMNVDLLRETHVAMVRWHTLWPELFRDPIRYYQRALEESIEATQRVFQATRSTAETMTESCQRLEHATEDTTRSLGETFRDASSRIQNAYGADRLRAA
jgi:hypothetical protein